MVKEYQPLEDRVLVIVIKPETNITAQGTGLVGDSGKTEGGIFIPGTAKKETIEAVVHAVGQGRFAGETGAFMPTVLHKGDLVLVGFNSGMLMDVPVAEKIVEMKLLREADVLLLIKKKEETND